MKITNPIDDDEDDGLLGDAEQGEEGVVAPVVLVEAEAAAAAAAPGIDPSAEPFEVSPRKPDPSPASGSSVE